MPASPWHEPSPTLPKERGERFARLPAPSAQSCAHNAIAWPVASSAQIKAKTARRFIEPLDIPERRMVAWVVVQVPDS